MHAALEGVSTIVTHLTNYNHCLAVHHSKLANNTILMYSKSFIFCHSDAHVPKSFPSIVDVDIYTNTPPSRHNILVYILHDIHSQTNSSEYSCKQHHPHNTSLPHCCLQHLYTIHHTTNTSTSMHQNIPVYNITTQNITNTLNQYYTSGHSCLQHHHTKYH